MDAWLIDPKARTVTAIPYDGTLDDAYRCIEASPISIVKLNDGLELIIDDEGLHRKDPAFFIVSGFNTAIAGKALCAPPRITLDELRSRVRWVTPDVARSKIRKTRAEIIAAAVSRGLNVEALGDDPEGPVLITKNGDRK